MILVFLSAMSRDDGATAVDLRRISRNDWRFFEAFSSPSAAAARAAMSWSCAACQI